MSSCHKCCLGILFDYSFMTIKIQVEQIPTFVGKFNKIKDDKRKY